MSQQEMSKQMTFEWPKSVAQGPEDFFVSAANEHAYRMLMSTPIWPQNKLLLVGDAQSGKSHLLRIWAQHNAATLLRATDLVGSNLLESLPNTALAIEDMHLLPSTAEDTMFHLHNHAQNSELKLVMSARTLPQHWTLRLPDLMSRMQATSHVNINDPDDDLMQVLLLKLFKDRQISPPPQVVHYLSTRLERSFRAANWCVDTLDTLTLREKKALTVPLVSQLLSTKEPPA